MDVGGAELIDHDVEGVVDMMIDATKNYAEPLSADRLFGWHAALFPTGRSGMRKIVVGAWRDDAHGPMQVVSGPVEKKRSTPRRRAPRFSTRRCRRFSIGQMTRRTRRILFSGPRSRICGS